MSEVIVVEVGPDERQEFSTINGSKAHLLVYLSFRQSFATKSSYWIDLYYVPELERCILLVQWNFKRPRKEQMAGSYFYDQDMDYASIKERFKTKFDDLTSEERESPWKYVDFYTVEEKDAGFLLSISPEKLKELSNIASYIVNYAKLSLQPTKASSPKTKVESPKTNRKKDTTFSTEEPPIPKTRETFKEVQKRNKVKATW